MEFEQKRKRDKTTVSTDEQRAEVTAEDGGRNLYVFEGLLGLAKILSQIMHK